MGPGAGLLPDLLICHSTRQWQHTVRP